MDHIIAQTENGCKRFFEKFSKNLKFGETEKCRYNRKKK